MARIALLLCLVSSIAEASLVSTLYSALIPGGAQILRNLGPISDAICDLSALLPSSWPKNVCEILSREGSDYACALEGITCNVVDMTISKIDLHSQKMTGELPASLGNLSSLISLDLSDNYLTGKFDNPLSGISFCDLSDNCVNCSHSICNCSSHRANCNEITGCSGCFIGQEGACFLEGQIKNATCKVCNASASRHSWSFQPFKSTCDDNLWCTSDDKCTADGQCTGSPSYCGADCLEPSLFFSTATNTDGNLYTQIYGMNFGPLGGNPTVEIEGVECTHEEITIGNFQISCLVPPGAGTNNNVTVWIPNKGSVLSRKTSAAIFSYNPPQILSVTSSETQGSVIQVTGVNFGPLRTPVAVSINNQACTNATVTIAHKQISCKAPVGQGTGKNISVVVPVSAIGKSQSDLATFFSYKIPEILSCSSVDTTGGKITISGRNFGIGSVKVNLTLDGREVICANATLKVDHTQITCYAPAGVGQNNLIKVTAESQSNQEYLFSYNPPVIYSASSTNTPGGLTTITGKNFGPAGTSVLVLIGKTVCEHANVTVNHTTIQCIAPSGSGRNLEVLVFVPSGSLNQGNSSAFSYAAPDIINMTSAGSGDQTLISGTNFGTYSSEIRVTIGGADCTNLDLALEHFKISCIVPEGSAVNNTVTVYVSGNSVSRDMFSYPQPLLLSIDKTPTGGSSMLTSITGSNFGLDGTKATVRIDGNSCTNATVRDGKIWCLVPEGVGADLTVEVWVPDLSDPKAQGASSTISFSYKAPVIQLGLTSKADPTGNDLLVIRGANFGPSTEISEPYVSINNLECTQANITVPHTEITCLPPQGVGTSNTLQVRVPNSKHSQVFTVLGLTYEAPILLDVPTPVVEGGMEIVTGENFGPGGSWYSITYSIDGKFSASATWVSQTALRVHFPSGVGCCHNFQVCVKDQYAYANLNYSAPSISNASRADTDGSTPVVLEITNLGENGTFTVYIGGQNCTNGLYIDSTHVSCYPPVGTGTNIAVELWVPDISNKHSQRAQELSYFSYNGPTIFSVDPPPTDGGFVQVTGTNFGQESSDVMVYVNGIPTTLYTLSVPHKVISLDIPPGCGSDSSVTVTVGGQSSSTTFTYAAPTVGNATPVLSGHGITSLTGSNFGVNASIISVNIVGVGPCTNVTVAVPHKSITCVAPLSDASGTFPLQVCVDHVCATSANVLEFTDIIPPSCFLSLESSKTSGFAEVILTCNETVWGISAEDFATQGHCTVDTVSSSLYELDFSQRQNSFTIKVKHTKMKHANCSLVLLAGHAKDYHNNTAPASNKIWMDFAQNENTKIIIGGSVGGFAFLAGAIVVAAVVLKKLSKQPPPITLDVEEDVVFFDEGSGTVPLPPSSSEVSQDTFPLQVSALSLTFGLEGHRAKVSQELSETLTLLNDTKHTWSFKFFEPKSYKFRLSFSPDQGLLRPKSSLPVNVKAMINCTTHIDCTVALAVSVGKEFGKKKIQHLLIRWASESKLSTKIDPTEIELETPAIGEGTFGSVFRGAWRGQQVAVKIMKDQNNLTPERKEAFLHEVQVMESIHCPYIVNFIGAVYVKGKLAIMSEFVELGSLGSVMRQYKLTPAQKLRILLDAAKGMNFLHKSGIVHRDLKIDNVLVSSIDETSTVCSKISDFGTTRDIQTSKDAMQMTKAIGTPTYMAPEVLQNNTYGPPSDVYSYGVLAYSLFIEGDPYSGPEFSSSWRMCEFVLSGKRLPLPKNLPEVMVTLIPLCWAQTPEERPTFKDIVATIEGTHE
ncbi:tyrosine protein kinase [Pelomyxa schiedti]|nr:tyrosine protein kinase [Pelomyxa schiedti]